MLTKALNDWLEKGILIIALAMMVAAPLMTGSVGVKGLLTLEILFAVAILMWILRIWFSPHFRLLWNPACWFSVAFAAWAFLCYLKSDLEYASRREFLLALFYSFFFLLVVNNIHQQKSVTLLTLVLIFLAMAISMYGIYQFFSKSEQVWWLLKPQVYVGRASGTYICPNHFAGYLEIIAPIGLAYTLAGRFGHVARILIGYATLVILAGVAMSVSRGSWVAVSLALVVLIGFLFRKRGYRLISVLMASCFLIGGLFFAFKADFSSKRLFDMKREWQEIVSGEGPENIRFKLWEPAFRIWTEPGEFWMGAGPGSFDDRFRKYRHPDIQYRPRYVHNDYLNFLVDWGLGGALLGLCWLGSLVWLFRGIWIKARAKSPFEDGGAKRSKQSRRSREGHGNKAPLLLGIALGLLAIAVHSFVDFNLHIPANALLVVTLLGILAGYYRFVSDRFWIRYTLPVKLICTLALGLVGTLLVTQGVAFVQEDTILERSKTLRDQPAEYLEALRQAHEIQPTNPATVRDMGDALWFMSQNVYENEEAYALKSMEWLELGMKLNPYNAYFPMRYGMCLYWLERKKEGDPYFEKALQLDPNNFYIVANEGWRNFHNGDYLEALKWFNKSLDLQFAYNKVAFLYHPITLEKIKKLGLEEKAEKGGEECIES